MDTRFAIMYSTCGIIAVALFGCDSRNGDTVVSARLFEISVDAVLECDTAAELKQFFAEHSLGGTVEINVMSDLIFVQSFPYSGVQASHLYVYTNEGSGLQFLSMLRLPTQGLVELRLQENDTVEIWIYGVRFAAIDQPSALELN